MMTTEPPAKTENCTDFVPQAWRKTLCVNCFHTLDEHGFSKTPEETKPSSNGEVKGSQSTQKVTKTPATPTSKSGATKVGTSSLKGKSTDTTPKAVENLSTKSKLTTDSKKQPPPVASKQSTEDSKQAAFTEDKSNKSTSNTSTTSTNVLTKFGSKTTSSATDSNRKQNGLDSKSKIASGVNKPEATLPASGKTPILSNKSVKSTVDDKSNIKKTASTDEKKEKLKSSEDLKGKPSKVFGLSKSFGSDDTSDVKSFKEKTARSDVTDSSITTDSNKAQNKDSLKSKSSSDQKHFSGAKSPIVSSDLSSTSARSNVSSAESIKSKGEDVTSHGKQTVFQCKDLKVKGSVDSNSASVKATETLQADSKSKTFASSSVTSAKVKDNNVTTLPSAKDADSAKYAEISKSLKSKEVELDKLSLKLKDLEEKCKKLTTENSSLKKMAQDVKKDDIERSLKSVQSQLTAMETKCKKLETDNSELQNKIKMQKDSQHSKTKSSKEISQLERDLEISDTECEQLKDENLELRKEVNNLKIEMEEMYDTFKENEMDEFRELQKELDLTAKNCRILQFKLRKAERRNDQIESERNSYEEKLRCLQNSFTSDDAKEHIQNLEADLKTAKEVSVRLHDEIDMIEDKKTKVEEENRQLTEILEQADKKQFRMEMDIDRLKDQIADLQQKVPRSTSDQESRDRRTY